MGSPLNDNVPEGHSVAYVEFVTVDIFLNSKTQLDITVLLSKCILSVSCLLPRSTSKEGSRQKIMGACKNKVKQYVTVRKKTIFPSHKNIFSCQLWSFQVYSMYMIMGHTKPCFIALQFVVRGCLVITVISVMEFLQRWVQIS